MFERILSIELALVIVGEVALMLLVISLILVAASAVLQDTGR